jgi:DNA repair exonuclease SbcCD nuclease subunit
LVLVHSSDIHVDDGYGTAANGGDGVYELRRVLDAAREVAADVILLAGDIFENNRLPEKLLRESAKLMADAGSDVVVLPGNHDPAIPESAWHRGAITEVDNVHILGITHDEAVSFPDLDLEVWGIAHTDYDDMEPLSRIRTRTTRWQVAMAHGHYEPVPDKATALRPSWLFGDREIAATKADYLALGHWNRNMRVGNGAVPAYYSGSPDLAGTVNVVRLGAGGKVTVRRKKLLAR